MVDIEDLSEEELDKLHKYYEKISALAGKENDIHTSHSIDAAEKLHEQKKLRKSKNNHQAKEPEHNDPKPVGRSNKSRKNPPSKNDGK